MPASQCLWTDLDTNKKYLIANQGGPDAAVFVNQGGQIPSRFTVNVSGWMGY